MSNSKKYDQLTIDIVEALKQVANELGVAVAQVTRPQLIKHGGVTDYSLRMVGGIDGVKARFFPQSEKDLAGIRLGKEVKTKLAAYEKALGEKELFQEQIQKQVLEAIKGLKLPKVQLPEVKSDKTKRSMTIELMLSDIHYGLKTPDFNLEICRNRIRHYVELALKEIQDNNKLFSVDRIIVALLGDIIQSATMHGLESMAGCEFGNSQQVQAAIESLWYDVLVPIASTGIRVDVPAVTGNHDRTETKRTYHYPGESNLTFIIYRTLEMLTKEAGFKNVSFHIPKGSFEILDIYGANCLYEHGDNSKANTKNAFEALITSRSKQSDKVIHFARFGHFHELKIYGRGRIIVNESVCGEESYGNVLGYKSVAGQCINYYLETKSRTTPFYKTLPVCLDNVT